MNLRNGMLPLVSVMSGIATGIVLLFATTLIGAMVFIIRLTTQDSGKHKELREFVEALFGTPSHLRPSDAGADEHKSERPVRADEPFSEPCPACGETVTHEHAECPSCGLRLL
ncbi:hypothetical protein KZ483_27225 [Paenibacillus sp. sptzw28]|uniref:hypothetical protein n=1 Tax=Paenibacillus sp. sptzw28 TaxID=715179 RepID=UPI001C6EFD93|nr:hypothetical protein [Paenibacillus sp. sptzw28]QYR21322.1 hypothetical protein KZ483_27225 [Paenibacillus sp. sptzw28]